jgi:hypothetical protein
MAVKWSLHRHFFLEQFSGAAQSSSVEAAVLPCPRKLGWGGLAWMSWHGLDMMGIDNPSQRLARLARC